MSGAIEIEVRPATSERWADVRSVLDGDEEQGCWCQPWRGLARRPGEPPRSRPEMMLAEIEQAEGAAAQGGSAEDGPAEGGLAEGGSAERAPSDGGPAAPSSAAVDGLPRRNRATSPPPGFVAYIGDLPVGWCGVAVRGSTPRLDRSRVIPLIDDLPVWAIGCFRIRVGHRRQGVARALLAGVIEAARASGAPGIEAYPIDPEGRRVDVSFAYVGIAAMFEAAGFRRLEPTKARSAGLTRWLMRLDFEGRQGQPTGDGA
jgi:GNAT superfamily N-acetyltransferase